MNVAAGGTTATSLVARQAVKAMARRLLLPHLFADHVQRDVRTTARDNGNVHA